MLLWDFVCNWPRIWKCSVSVRCWAVNHRRRLDKEPGYHSWPNLFQSRKVIEWLPFSAQGINRRLWWGLHWCWHKLPTRLYNDIPCSSTQLVHLDHTGWKSYVKWFSSGNYIYYIISVPSALFCAKAWGPWEFFLFPLADNRNELLGDYVSNLAAILPNLTAKSQQVGLLPKATCLWRGEFLLENLMKGWV